MIDKTTTLTILRTLSQCSGYSLPEETLFQQINLTTPKLISMAFMREHLTHANDKGWVTYTVDQIDRSQRWSITPEGKLLL